ncbi:protein jagged-1a-like [Cajanus cajan]|uniref:EGF-like domain-containing protein n=1 Tax=Cajanus cajan TaxID=3821 RepID=A0A151SGZ8_CAJCA|nr:protein jagged-1a-like [Cajanus cajan]KYP53991.1 hypothetical protein KK1_000156 [Cajanus cajan]
MGMLRWTMFALVSLYPLFTCEVSATSTQLISNSTQDDIINICSIVYCGKGTCHPSSTEPLGFRCDCESGWKKPNIGSFQFPTCIFPNCTIDLNCGNGSPSPPSAPPTNVDPCLLNICGDGTCVKDGSDFRCECNEGSANLLNDPKLLCFKKCTLGGDCNGLGLGFSSQSTETPQTSGTASLPAAGSGETVSGIKEVHMVAMTILALIFQICN